MDSDFEVKIVADRKKKIMAANPEQKRNSSLPTLKVEVKAEPVVHDTEVFIDTLASPEPVVVIENLVKIEVGEVVDEKINIAAGGFVYSVLNRIYL